MAVEQLPLPLQAQQHYSADYFVSHSGVADALRFFEESADRLQREPDFFQSLYLYGPPGVGKSHLLSMMRSSILRRGLPAGAFEGADFGASDLPADAHVGEIVSRYEQLRTEGGLLVFASRFTPEGLTKNPHLLSRLRSSAIFEVRSPSIDELRPTLQSLLERRNLRLSERNLDYLLRRVPTNPLSLWGILAKMDDRALREGRTVSLHFIREILGEI